jgi:hypothetical protein
MMLTRRSVTFGSATLAATTIALGPEALAATRRRRLGRSAENGQAVLDWERISFRTLYVDSVPATPIPAGIPVLGFVSVAMHHAAKRSAHLGISSESAAVARAAHDVLVRYCPSLEAKLDAELATTFGAIGASPARSKGSRIGADAARDMLESRKGDGYLDPTIHYVKTAGPGVWTPNAGSSDMLAPWLGSLRALYVSPVPVSGPYSLGSAAWAADYDEARRTGGKAPTERTQAETDTAVFMDTNIVVVLTDAVIRYLEAHPVGILATSRVFAMVHASMTDSIINCWKLKRDVGFWRPMQAIAGPCDDGNPATEKQPGWEPLRNMPNYSDYVSGHGSIVGPAVQVIRRTFGENAQLELRSPNAPGLPRTYPLLADLEADALMARVWGGFHFRKAVADAYEMAHRTADRVVDTIGA